MKDSKQGILLYHHLHGIVKFVKFNYGFCCVEAQKSVYLYSANGLIETKQTIIWVKISVVTSKLIKYNKKKHGEIFGIDV